MERNWRFGGEELRDPIDKIEPRGLPNRCQQIGIGINVEKMPLSTVNLMGNALLFAELAGNAGHNCEKLHGRVSRHLAD